MMENSKHTPGPWRVSTDRDYIVVLSNDNRLDVSPCNPTKEERKEAKYNAKLIAAAPELLSALISLKDIVGKGDVYNEVARLAFANAKNVIKKATE